MVATKKRKTNRLEEAYLLFQKKIQRIKRERDNKIMSIINRIESRELEKVRSQISK